MVLSRTKGRGVDRRHIVETFARTQNVSATARICACTHETVRRWARCDVDQLVDKPRSGRPKTVTSADVASFKRSAKRNKTAIEIVKERMKRGSSSVSPGTVRRALASGRKPLKWQPILNGKVLSAKNRALRVTFCNLHKQADVSKWVFLDAKYFYLYKAKRGHRQWAWAETDAETALGTPWCFFVYAAVAKGHKTKLHFVSPSPPLGSRARKAKQSFNGSHFREMLDKLVPEVAAWYPDGGWQLVMDRASQHTAAASEQKLADMGVKVLDLPAQCWDINIIEPTWGAFNQKLIGKRACTTRGWRRQLNQAWKAVEQSTIDSLVAEVNDRMQQISKAEGAWCKK